MGSGIKSKNVRDHGICITLRGARYLLIQRLERVGGGGWWGGWMVPPRVFDILQYFTFSGWWRCWRPVIWPVIWRALSIINDYGVCMTDFDPCSLLASWYRRIFVRIRPVSLDPIIQRWLQHKLEISWSLKRKSKVPWVFGHCQSITFPVILDRVN